MIETKKIIEKIQNGLKGCSEKHNIPAKDVQLKIKPDGKVDLMNANETVGQIDILKVFGISTLENVIFPISPYLKKTLLALAKKKNIDQTTANARLFTKQSDFYPCVYLYDGEKVVCELTINELLDTK